MPRIGEELVRLATVDSTNNYAAKGVAQGEFRHGTVILAHEQTAGQGQRGRHWIMAPGLDLALSVVLLPEQLTAMAQFKVAKLAALAVHDTVAGILADAGRDVAEVRVKWPNDVLVGRNKVAGILIVNELKGAAVASSIVGIGLNVNSTGPEGETGATSLYRETGRTSDLEQVRILLCGNLERWWAHLAADDTHIASAYSACLWAKGRFSGFTLDGAAIQARPLDVDAAGRLIVEDEAGSVAAYGLERLRFMR
jgi:BirA family biotin operon repressor/biotin-[acetyl-CoA-carboxylase] ligase